MSANRLCLVIGCDRLGANGYCWRHRTTRATGAVDPRELAIGAERRAASLARLERLHEADQVCLKSRRRRGTFRQAVRREADALSVLLRAEIVAELVGEWQGHGGHPLWLLPPNGWLDAAVHDRYPEIPVERSRYGVLPHLDSEARAWFDIKFPPEYPFKGVGHERRGVDAAALAAFSAQAAHNVEYAAHRLEPHLPAIVQWVDHSVGGGLDAVFSDRHVNTEVPGGTVVHHSLGRRSTAFQSNIRSNWAVVRHKALQAGTYVRYSHVRASTLKTWWFGSLGNSVVPWIEESTPDPDALRLELAPRRGLFVGGAMGSRWQSIRRNEMEVVLPPHTTWRVVGHRDVVIDDARGSSPDRRRMHAIQMVEVESAPPGVKVVDMTAPEDDCLS